MMGIEMLPNWHPVFVHFTVALYAVSALFYLVGFVLKKQTLGQTFLTVGRWNLWLGALFTIGTVAAGFYAYNTVAHDGPSHAAMTDHRNWALGTAAVFWGLALWSLWNHRGAKTVNVIFIVLILAASGLLATTGYKGGEAVYRYGLGVMSMPQITGDGGHGSHSHGDESAAHSEASKPGGQGGHAH